MIINIYSKGRYPADALSNFAPHTFDFDGYEHIPSMESFLQSLKFPDPHEQERVLYLPPREAKKVGSEQPWNTDLYWKGQAIDRYSDEYRALLMRAYRQLLQNPHFRAALAASGRKLLFHTIGKTFRRNTILTWWEFVGILHQLRKEVR